LRISAVLEGPQTEDHGGSWKVQDGTTASMIFPVAKIIADLSQIVTLFPGDLVFTGTPAGVGKAHGIAMQPGNVLTSTIDGICSLRNTIIQYPPQTTPRSRTPRPHRSPGSPPIRRTPRCFDSHTGSPTPTAWTWDHLLMMTATSQPGSTAVCTPGRSPSCRRSGMRCASISGCSATASIPAH